MRRVMIAVVLAGLAAITGVGIWQMIVAGDEQQVLDGILDRQQRALEMAKAVASNQERFALELESYRLDLANLRRAFPEAFEVEAHLEAIREVARRHEVEVVDASPRRVRKEFYDVAEISLDLKGEARNAENAIADMLEGEPVTVAEDLRQDAGHTKVRLLRYAVPIDQKPGRFQPCEFTPSRVWFPGLRAKIATRRAEAEETCNAVASMREFVEQVNQFHMVREELELLNSIAAALLPEHAELLRDEDGVGSQKPIDGPAELIELE